MLSFLTLRPTRRRVPLPFCAVLLLLAAPVTAAAQTDYYNTDAGRPLTIEDAYAIERRAIELQVAPLRLERSRGAYAWAIEPEIALGVLPRTQLEIGLPFAWIDDRHGGSSSGLAGAELSVLHNLNVETSLPALGVAAGLTLPVGPLGPARTYPSLKAIATKTFTWARFHVNGQYTFGEEDDAAGDSHAGEQSRWLAGVAIDRTFPLESFLVTGELFAQQPLAPGEDRAWSTAAGIRYQLSPRVAADGGAGYRLTGDVRGWYATFGAAVALGLPWSAHR